MVDDENIWVDAPTWREIWNETGRLPGGGQGIAFRASRKSDGREAFIKEIKRKTDPERRARFFREASAYDTFQVAGIPNLIESNAHLHGSSGNALYIATGFVTGPTLIIWREQQSRVELHTAVTTTRALLKTLCQCHAKNCVHRDVKPDNIILEHANPEQPVLLDFGLSYH